jgi:hypothetical protein
VSMARMRVMGMGVGMRMVVPMIMVMTRAIRLPFYTGLAFATTAYGTHHSTSRS